MKRILIILLLTISLAGYSQSRLQLNPITGDLEYSGNVSYMSDTLINFGKGNEVGNPKWIKSSIGYNAVTFSENSIIIGFNAVASCRENFILGSHFRCNSDHAFSISGSSAEMNIGNDHIGIPGAVRLGYFNKRRAMYVHSGYNSAEPYCGDIGGVLINRWWSSRPGEGQILYYADSALALSVYSHRGDGNSYIMKMKDSGGVEKLSINDQGTATVTGSFEAGSIISNYTPLIYHASGDTSFVPVPNKLGDLYIDTSVKDVYISNATDRGGWLKVNE